LGYSTNELSREFARLKRLYTECSRENRPGKKRFAFYEYLYEVYSFHSRWRAAIGPRNLRAQIFGLFSPPPKPDQYLLKLIIDASCTADHKTRSRWGQALRYAWRRRKQKRMSRREFDEFLHCNGGVVGSAVKCAVPKMKVVEGRLGYGFDALAVRKRCEPERSRTVLENRYYEGLSHQLSVAPIPRTPIE
jgi:hypothetical protein